MKQYKVRDFEKILRQNGYKFDRQNGSHKIWKSKNNSISVPSIKLVDVVARRLIKENNLNM